MGFAHRAVVTTKNGRFEQDRLATCIIPTALDAPPMRVDILEKPFTPQSLLDRVRKVLDAPAASPSQTSTLS